MAVIVKKFRVNTGNKIYFPGESVPGLSPKEEAELVSSGICEYERVIEVFIDNDGSKSTELNGNQPEAVGFPTVEQFKELKAEVQKDFLSKQNIEPGTNEKDRLQQYSDFLATFDIEDESDEEDQDGPNTEMPTK